MANTQNIRAEADGFHTSDPFLEETNLWAAQFMAMRGDQVFLYLNL
jgi:hypothetical protein